MPKSENPSQSYYSIPPLSNQEQNALIAAVLRIATAISEKQGVPSQQAIQAGLRYAEIKASLLTVLESQAFTNASRNQTE